MSVASLQFWKIKPGCMQGAIEHWREGSKHVRNAGARDVRFRRIVFGGEEAGIHYAMSTFDSMTEYGEFVDAITKNEEFTKRAGGPDAPMVPIGRWVTLEIAHFGAENDGPVSLLRTWKVDYKRMPEFLKLVEEVVDHSDEPSMSVSVRAITIGGEYSGQIITSGSVPDMETLGAYADRLETNPELQKLQAKAFGSNDSPGKLLGMRVAVDVPV